MKIRLYHRISQELYYLTEKMASLDKFLNGNRRHELSDAHINLLLTQLGTMKEYAAILVSRLHLGDDTPSHIVGM